MTDRPEYGAGAEGSVPPFPPPAGYSPPPPGYGPPPGYPPPNYGQPSGYYPPPAYVDPTAPYGRHPLTGEPFSDKSKVTAGLLQLLGFFGLVGIGRIYIGDTTMGVVQLVVGILTCGIGAWIWGVIDAILIFTDKVRDQNGRPLRDGT